MSEPSGAPAAWTELEGATEWASREERLKRFSWKPGDLEVRDPTPTVLAKANRVLTRLAEEYRVDGPQTESA